MFRKKKSILGIAPKLRTRADVDKEYNHNAIMLGHHYRMMSEATALIEAHTNKLIQLSKEEVLPEAEVKLEEKPADV